MDLEKLRRKLQEAKSIEERKIVLEWVRWYLDYLRELYVKCVDSIRRLSYAATVIVPINAMLLALSSHVVLLPHTLLTVLVVLCSVTIGLTVLMYRDYKTAMDLEREIIQLVELIVDPSMRYSSLRAYLIYGIVLAALSTIILILAIMQTIGTIHLV